VWTVRLHQHSQAVDLEGTRREREDVKRNVHTDTCTPYAGQHSQWLWLGLLWWLGTRSLNDENSKRQGVLGARRNSLGKIGWWLRSRRWAQHHHRHRYLIMKMVCANRALICIVHVAVFLEDIRYWSLFWLVSLLCFSTGLRMYKCLLLNINGRSFMNVCHLEVSTLLKMVQASSPWYGCPPELSCKLSILDYYTHLQLQELPCTMTSVAMMEWFHYVLCRVLISKRDLGRWR